MRIKYGIIAIFLLFAASQASAYLVVHDGVMYVFNTVKAIQDELYQQLDFDIQAQQLGTAGETLKTGIDTLKVAKDTYNTAMDIYNTATDIANRVGDPMQLTAYMNSRFWHENEVSAALNITREAMDMADSKVANTGNIEYMLRQMEYGLMEAEVQRSRDLAHTQKGAIAVHKFMAEWGPKALLQMTELNREDQKYNGRNSSLTEMQYADYRNGIWQSNTLGQMFAAQTAHSSMVAEQYYMENTRRDWEDLQRSQIMYDNWLYTNSGAKALQRSGSVSENFIDDFVGR